MCRVFFFVFRSFTPSFHSVVTTMKNKRAHKDTAYDSGFFAEISSVLF